MGTFLFFAILFVCKLTTGDATDISGNNEEKRIIGGTDTDISVVPYQLSFRRLDKNNEYEHICGASILSYRVALTAAHCTYNKQPIKDNLVVVAGTNRISDAPRQQLTVNKIFNHPEFDVDTYDNDVSVLYLVKHFAFNVGVQPIILPNSEVMEGKLLKVSGWGSTSENETYPDHLKSIDVPILNRGECRRRIPNYIISDNMICAGYDEGKRDACVGDSGGPLATSDGVQYGIVSWGIGCGRENKPGVYTNVFKYKSWIENIVAENKP